MILGLLRSTGTVTYKWARRLVIALIGTTVCLLGLAMLVLPGPGLLVIPLGLGILGLEFAFARRWLLRVRESANGVVSEAVKWRWWRRPPPPDGPG